VDPKEQTERRVPGSLLFVLLCFFVYLYVFLGGLMGASQDSSSDITEKERQALQNKAYDIFNAVVTGDEDRVFAVWERDGVRVSRENVDGDLIEAISGDAAITGYRVEGYRSTNPSDGERGASALIIFEREDQPVLHILISVFDSDGEYVIWGYPSAY